MASKPFEKGKEAHQLAKSESDFTELDESEKQSPSTSVESAQIAQPAYIGKFRGRNIATSVYNLQVNSVLVSKPINVNICSDFIPLL